MTKLMPIILILTLGFFYSGCKGQEGAPRGAGDTELSEEKAGGPVSETEEKIEKIHETEERREEARAPSEIAADLWKLLQTENYRDRWQMWPGKDALYKGKHPHGALLTTYINSTGYESAAKKEKELPPGTIIVKENYSPEKTLSAITVMYNLPGFDPEHGGWFWVKYDADGVTMTEEKNGTTVTLAGEVAACIGCHSASNSGIQYIMTTTK